MPGPKSRPAIDRAWPKIDKRGPDECWNWTGATNPKYGQLGAGPGGGTLLAHRLIYMHEVGPIPDGLEIDHLCKNTICCNPRHLEAVPPRVNRLHRCDGPAGINSRKEACVRGHEFTDENTRVTRAGKRHCVTCSRMRDRARHAGIPFAEWLAQHGGNPEIKPLGRGRPWGS